MTESILVGKAGDLAVELDPAMANRHGLITGATGTGKTVTLQMLAESFARAGVPVFSADVKGDLSGIAKAAGANKGVQKRVKVLGMDDYRAEPNATLFWDLDGARGHPVRTTVSDMGPVLLANLLELNETQAGVLQVAFSVADDEGLLLLDLKDLRAMLNWTADNAKDIERDYGRVSRASVSAILRRLLVLEESGGDKFFGEPALRIKHLMQTDFSGRGVVSLLDATSLQGDPRIYATFLLWLLSELMEELPERGDQPLPRLVFFFDEAHLLFDNAPPALIERVTQVVRLIRSKGVGVFFVSQYPNDIPDDVLGQLGNRVQHALRAYTPRDKKAVKAAAETFRQNPEIDTVTAIGELGVGEALVSTLDEDGVPSMVQRVLIAPPRSRLGPLSNDERQELVGRSPILGTYEDAVDRESAYELLEKREAEREAQRGAAAREQAERKAREQEQRRSRSSSGGRRRQSVGEAMMKSAARSVGSALGRKIVRGILGSIFGGR